MANVPQEIAILKIDILTALTEQTKRFQERTGLYPCAIRIDIHEVTIRGDKAKQFLISNVEVDFSY